MGILRNTDHSIWVVYYIPVYNSFREISQSSPLQAGMTEIPPELNEIIKDVDSNGSGRALCRLRVWSLAARFRV